MLFKKEKDKIEGVKLKGMIRKALVTTHMLLVEALNSYKGASEIQTIYSNLN